MKRQKEDRVGGTKVSKQIKALGEHGGKVGQRAVEARIELINK